MGQAITALAIALGSLPAAAQTGAAGAPEPERPWPPLIKACVTLESELIQGLRTPADAQDAIQDLLESGDTALRSSAEPLAGSTWDLLIPADAALREATQRVADGLVEAKRAAVANALAPLTAALPDKATPIQVDPWAGPDQECGYVPRDPGPVTTVGGKPCPPIPLGDLPKLIPARYRLAEALGIGKNRFECTPRYIDPTLSHLPSSGKWDIRVLARLHCELVGRFDLSVEEGEETTAGVGEETVRLVVSSQGRTTAGSNRQ